MVPLHPLNILHTVALVQFSASIDCTLLAPEQIFISHRHGLLPFAVSQAVKLINYTSLHPFLSRRATETCCSRLGV